MEKISRTAAYSKTLSFFHCRIFSPIFLQTLYGMADLFIIGQFASVADTTAVSVGSQIMHMLTVMIVGLAMGTTVSIANAVGAGDRKRAAQSIGNTVTLFMSLSVVLMGLLLLSVRPITAVMATPPQAVASTVSYLTVCFLGIPFITAYNILASVFRGMGDSKSPMYFIAVACVCNIGLDFLFIGALGLGPVGAALGTTLSQTVSVALSLCVIVKKRSIGLSKSDFKPKKAVMRRLLSIGLPVAAQDGLIRSPLSSSPSLPTAAGLIQRRRSALWKKSSGSFFWFPPRCSPQSQRSARKISARASRSAP